MANEVECPIHLLYHLIRQLAIVGIHGLVSVHQHSLGPYNFPAWSISCFNNLSCYLKYHQFFISSANSYSQGEETAREGRRICILNQCFWIVWEPLMEIYNCIVSWPLDCWMKLHSTGTGPIRPPCLCGHLACIIPIYQYLVCSFLCLGNQILYCFNCESICLQLLRSWFPVSDHHLGLKNLCLVNPLSPQLKPLRSRFRHLHYGEKFCIIHTAFHNFVHSYQMPQSKENKPSLSTTFLLIEMF